MKRFTLLVTGILRTGVIVAICAATTCAQNTRYFDLNDNGADSGVTNNSPPSMAFVWDTSTPYWNPNADGSGAGPGTTVAWVNGDNAVFSAGNDAAGLRYFIDIIGGTTANSAVIEDGTFVLNSGTFDTGTGTTEVLSGATLELKSGPSATYGLNGGGVLKLSGGRLLSSGAASAANPVIDNLKTIEINGTGTIANDDGNSGVVASAFVSNVITGTGGTPSNGGAGTLIKSGPDTIVLTGRDTGGGVFNWQLNSFAKLSINQGIVRIKGAAGNVIDERLLGALPTSTLPDAITLDGVTSAIGATQSVTLDAKRGITIAAGGGSFDHGTTGAAGNINVPGPLTAAPGALLTIGLPGVGGLQTTATLELSNANNVSTFQGNILMRRSALQLDSSLNVANFSGSATSSSVFGIVRIAAGTTLTVGADNADANYDGSIANLASGAGSGGIFTKVGSGTLTLNTISTSAAWSNTGGVNINNGTIKYANVRAGFFDSVPVSIGATGKLNMNGFGDTFGSLSGPAGAIVDMKDTAASPGTLTLTAAANTTYSGTIVGGGNLTKGSAATSTGIQKLGGNTTLGAVAANFGTLVNNATMTASGGVTVGSAGTFGGSGTVVGNVLNNGILAPGDAGVGTLGVTGNVTDGASSHWAIELDGATADRLAVVGNIDLSAVDSLDVTGAGTGTSWIIATYTGGVSGTFNNITSGYTVSYAGGKITLNAPPTGVPGDFNNDGKVDAADYVTWKKNEGTNNALVNDNGLGTPIGSGHYNLWRTNFGNPPGAGSGESLGIGAVPEPASIGLMSLGLAALGLGRTNRRGTVPVGGDR